MRVPSKREREIAARIRVRADKQLGYLTPKWIVELANDKLGKELFSRERNTMSTPIYDSVSGVTTDENGQPTAKPTAKVRNGTITGLALAVGVAVLNAVTPDMLEPLGSWGVLIYAGIVALSSSLAAYLTKPTGIS